MVVAGINQFALIFDFFVIGLGTGATYAVLGVSFAIIVRVTGILHFAHGGIFALAGLMFIVLTSTSHVSFPLAALAAVVSATVLGGAIYWTAYRPLERRRTGMLGTFVTSLGLLIVIESLLSLWAGPNARFGTVGSTLGAPLWLHGSIIVRKIDVFSLVLALVILVLLGAVWGRTRFGLVLKSLESNRSLASELRIPYERFAFLAFVLGSGLCAISAIIYSLSQSASPFGGTDMLLNAFVAMVIGGTRSIWASAVGGLLLGVVQTVPLVWLGGSWIDAMSFGVLMVVLLLAPNGVTNLARRRT